MTEWIKSLLPVHGVGKLIVHAATGNLKKVSLELGGKPPMSSSKTPTLDTGDRRLCQRHLLQPWTVLLCRSRLFVERGDLDLWLVRRLRNT